MYLTAAILTICVAHLIRTKRWRLFVEIYEKPSERALLQSLSAGFFLNFFLPFKGGDIVRALYAGRYMKNGKTLAFTTVIVDRYLDIVTVGLMYMVLFFCTKSGVLWTSTRFYIALMVGLLFGTLLIVMGRSLIKKTLMYIARVFNPKIELQLLKLSWSLITNFKDIFVRISKTKMLVNTVGMWALYLLSYSFFSEYLSSGINQYGWIDIFTMFFAKSSIELSGGNAMTIKSLIQQDTLGTFLYLSMPILILFVLSFLATPKRPPAGEDPKYLNLLPQLHDDERRRFLELYFSNEKQDLIKNYLKINQDISIIRDYSAGSNAKTMLCLNDKGTFFRKYAFAGDGDKLYEQVLWLQQHQGTLPLPEILRYAKENSYCYYDMPYQSNSIGLFTYAHSMPIEKSWNIIQRTLEALEDSVYQQNRRPADPETISHYVSEKVYKNLKKIREGRYIKGLSEYDEVLINGVSYPNLACYEQYLTKAYLIRIFKDDVYSDIHGDLTIENIVCTRRTDGVDDFYIIDPNTGNLHESANLDYGKLLQSIHGGYEFLMATQSVAVKDNQIDFTFTKSQTYIELHDQLRTYMNAKFPYEHVRSIYYHEIIHWLRLMPYKIERDGQRSLLFYAGLLMVLRDVVEMFEETKDEKKPSAV